MIWRIGLTLVIMAIGSAITAVLNIYSPTLTNQLAANQLNGGDMGWYSTMGWLSFLSSIHTTLFVVGAAIIACIWWHPALRLIKSFGAPGAAAIILTILAASSPTPADAYRAKSDYTEVLIAKADETVILTPLMGDTKAGQAKLNSEEFYRANLVASKYVTIPHAKLQGSGDLFNDYVNSHQAIVVKRTPFAREYVSSSSRGSSSKDESFHCETAQSHNVSTGVAIGAMIKEEDAPKYLYYFGPDNAKAMRTSQSDGDYGKDTTFVSAIQARDFNDVMDTFGRRLIQTELCKQFSARSTDDAIKDKAAIMGAATEAARKQLGDMGITVLYMGFAEPLNFDAPIQHAINETYIATKRAAVANTLKDAMPVLKQQASIELMFGIAEAAKNGKLPAFPSFIGAIPPEFTEALKAYVLNSSQAVQVKP
jgi:hypothetical protein